MNRKDKLRRIFTLANMISLSRILLAIPLVMALDKGWFDESIRYQICFCIILVIFLSDVLDGFVARWMDQVSNIGKIIDPIADKICMMVVMIYLINEYREPFFIFFLLITTRDTLLIVVGIYLLQFQDEVFQSILSGKIFMFISSLMMGAYIFPFSDFVRFPLYILSLLFFIVSSFNYIQNYRQRFLEIRNAGHI